MMLVDVTQPDRVIVVQCGNVWINTRSGACYGSTKQAAKSVPGGTRISWRPADRSGCARMLDAITYPR